MFALYRKGNTHIVDGIECEVARVSIDALDTYRSEGWVDNVSNLLKQPKIEPELEPKKEGFLQKIGLKK
jgi:hypothetical protein